MVAAGPPAVLCVTAIVICKAMAGTGCGISSLSPQCPGQCSETADGPPARVVAARPPAVLCVTAIVIGKAMAGTAAGFPLSLRSVRRSVQRLQKGLRRAWSPLGPRRFCALVPL